MQILSTSSTEQTPSSTRRQAFQIKRVEHPVQGKTHYILDPHRLFTDASQDFEHIRHRLFSCLKAGDDLHQLHDAGRGVEMRADESSFRTHRGSKPGDGDTGCVAGQDGLRLAKHIQPFKYAGFDVQNFQNSFHNEVALRHVRQITGGGYPGEDLVFLLCLQSALGNTAVQCGGLLGLALSANS